MMKASTLSVGSCRLTGPSPVSTRGRGLHNDRWSFPIEQMHGSSKSSVLEKTGSIVCLG